jgi:hypothetical protein
MFDYRLEHLFSYTVTLSRPEVIGPVPEGIRVNTYITGGEVSGPRIQGRVRPAGADFFTIRRDGVGILDVHVTIETHDGALIYAPYSGVGDLGEDGYEKFLRGEAPRTVALRTVPRFHTAHPEYLWLNRPQCLGIGAVNFEQLEVHYDLYAVR